MIVLTRERSFGLSTAGVAGNRIALMVTTAVMISLGIYLLAAEAGTVGLDQHAMVILQQRDRLDGDAG
jgi:hypothetical protein